MWQQLFLADVDVTEARMSQPSGVMPLATT
jgi:hypothetical protein